VDIGIECQTGLFVLGTSGFIFWISLDPQLDHLKSVKDKNLGAQFSDKKYGEKARAANNIRRVNLMVNAASQDDKMVIKYELCALCVVHVVSYY